MVQPLHGVQADPGVEQATRQQKLLGGRRADEEGEDQGQRVAVHVQNGVIRCHDRVPGR